MRQHTFRILSNNFGRKDSPCAVSANGEEWNVLSSLRGLVRVMVALKTFHAAWAFQPPLTEVQASLTTNNFSRTVHYAVDDPVLGKLVEGSHTYVGSASLYWLVTNLTVANGIVAWVANARGSFELRDQEIRYAVYDVSRQAWREDTTHYEANISEWKLTAPRVTNGVVMWQADGIGLINFWDTAIGFATYDPLAGTWRDSTQRYHGVDWSYWVITNWQTDSGLMTWTRKNVGQLALGQTEVNYAIFDSTASTWMEDSHDYEGRFNNAWTVLNPLVTSQTVTWTATNQSEMHHEVRGYQKPERRWDSRPTAATAAFATSKTIGHAPLSVWFTDLSMGATNWSWSFGDGSTSTFRSLSHAFQQPGTYTVTQSVEGPSGTDSVAIIIGVDLAPSFLAFDTPRVTVMNGWVHLPILRTSGLGPIILETSSTLVDWQSISTNPPQSGPIELAAPLLSNGIGQFYRARVLSPSSSRNGK